MATFTLDRLPQTIEASSTEHTINLNPKRLYTVYHTGKDASGSDATSDVFLQCDGTPASNHAAAVAATTPENSYANKSGKLIVQSGVSYPIPAGTSQIKSDMASGTAVLQFVASEAISSLS